jgi:uncharacterized membrane protein YgcG
VRHQLLSQVAQQQGWAKDSWQYDPSSNRLFSLQALATSNVVDVQGPAGGKGRQSTYEVRDCMQHSYAIYNVASFCALPPAALRAVTARLFQASSWMPAGCLAFNVEASDATLYYTAAVVVPCAVNIIVHYVWCLVPAVPMQVSLAQEVPAAQSTTPGRADDPDALQQLSLVITASLQAALLPQGAVESARALLLPPGSALAAGSSTPPAAAAGGRGSAGAGRGGRSSSSSSRGGRGGGRGGGSASQGGVLQVRSMFH